MNKLVWKLVLVAGVLLLVFSCALLAAIVLARPDAAPSPAAAPASWVVKKGDQQLAYLLVKLELRTRTVMKEHYARPQSAVPGADLLYKRWLARNAILPAAVADRIFSEVVPGATGGRAWVKMVVDKPRNPNNRGDAVALEMLKAIEGGKANEERSTGEAIYYAEPIKSTAGCLPCHGDPAGAPDPMFPQYTKDGWKDGQIIGAVVARVAPEK
jgi:hypothetical protein